jgi:hypothetical protein
VHRFIFGVASCTNVTKSFSRLRSGRLRLMPQDLSPFATKCQTRCDRTPSYLLPLRYVHEYGKTCRLQLPGSCTLFVSPGLGAVVYPFLSIWSQACIWSLSEFSFIYLFHPFQVQANRINNCPLYSRQPLHTVAIKQHGPHRCVLLVSCSHNKTS